MYKFVIILAVMLLALAGCSADSLPQEEIPVSAGDAMTCECAVYMNSRGYLVPVTVRSEWGDIYSSVCASLKSGVTGREGIIPQEAQVSVSSENGEAHVTIAGAPEMEKAEARRMIEGTAATLLQFGGISSVSFQINDGSESFCGVDISAPVTGVNLNPAYSIGDYKPFTVWYKTADGLMLPVTKEAPEHSAKVLINAMIKTPADTENLSSLFPEGTLLNSAVLEDGTLKLDFSEQFYAAAAIPDGEKLLMQGINMTCSQIEGVKDVSITVNGTEYESEYSFGSSARSVFSNNVIVSE